MRIERLQARAATLQAAGTKKTTHHTQIAAMRLQTFQQPHLGRGRAAAPRTAACS